MHRSIPVETNMRRGRDFLRRLSKRGSGVNPFSDNIFYDFRLPAGNELTQRWQSLSVHTLKEFHSRELRLGKRVLTACL
jgi:hypothetical protein